MGAEHGASGDGKVVSRDSDEFQSMDSWSFLGTLKSYQEIQSMELMGMAKSYQEIQSMELLGDGKVVPKFRAWSFLGMACRPAHAARPVAGRQPTIGSSVAVVRLNRSA